MTERGDLRADIRNLLTHYLALVVLALFAFAGCADVGPSTSPSCVATPAPLPLRAGELGLVSHQPLCESLGIVCAGVGLNAIVRGDPGDPRVVWLTDAESATRIEVAWPPGYRARFVPALEILDGAGQVKLRGGDRVQGTCGTAAGGAVILHLSMPWADT